MVHLFRLMVVASLFSFVSETSAQSIGVVSSPAVCPKCGRVHAAPPAVAPVSWTSTAISPQVSSPRMSSPRTSAAVNTIAASTGGTSNVLATLNAQRARQGLRSLAPDASLQAVAQRRATKMASMGTKSHPPGSFAPGRYEGVGWNSSYSPSGVSACFTSDPNMRVAGAAMARGRDGVYFCVVYR